MKKEYRNILKKIKQYDKIVIARHISPDPDALGSSIGMKEIINDNFKNKKVIAIGAPAARLNYFGKIDKMTDDMYQDSLLIVLDTPDIKRIDGADPSKFDCVIKMDHHPIIDVFGDIEIIDSDASSACQIVLEFCFENNLKISTSVAEKLYLGIVSDTNRFLYNYTTLKTFKLVTRLLEITEIDFTSLYKKLYMKPEIEMKFQSYIMSNLKITKNGLGYIYLGEDIIKKYKADNISLGDIINSFNFINELLVWALFSEDKKTGLIKGTLRSRGPEINRLAENFNGGGHAHASGTRLKTKEEMNQLIEELELLCQEYKKR